MDVTERRRLIERYKDGYRVVMEALAGATEAELDAREGPAEWSPRDVAHHLADGEMTSAIRLRRLIAEEHPRLDGYDEAEFARRLYYERPITASLAAFKAARELTAEILERLSEAEWARAGTHSASGQYSVVDWLRACAAHAQEHAEQIRRARAATR